MTCKDAALPIGKLYKLRDAADAERSARSPRRQSHLHCAQGDVSPGLAGSTAIDCKLKDADVGYRVYQSQRGKLFYSAEGLAGYDSVLQLALRSLVADQPVKGEVSIATTGMGDPAAFARVQAGTLDPPALAEAYRRNNAGSYAEAAEFFAAVSCAGDAPLSRAEALANEALQKSNLGRYAEADALFARAAEARRVRPDRAPAAAQLPGHAPAQSGRAQGRACRARQAAAELSSKSAEREPAALEIDAVDGEAAERGFKLGQQLGAASDELLPGRETEILDAQALQLRGTSLRLIGDPPGQRCAAHSRRQAGIRARRQGRFDPVDARADPRRSCARSPKSRATAEAERSTGGGRAAPGQLSGFCGAA